ncbi:hypothetical protein CC2G_010881 [Coprinopsis cinerea AmutBmut pab1-1]|nr:hypothetical protein CC2G_010881 [Coprinopsis cinerea AmutBmut pab1-1]
MCALGGAAPLFLKIAQEGNYSTAAGLSLLTFDVFSTFQDEVRYIWRSRWSVAKVAYLLARYWALVFMIVILAGRFASNSDERRRSDEIDITQRRRANIVSSCQGYFIFHNFFGDLFCMTIVSVISILRVYALYGNSLKVLIFTILACSCAFAMEFYAAWAATSISLPLVFVISIPQFTGCLARMPASAVKNTLFAWVPSIAIALLFFVLTLARFRQALRDHYGKAGRDHAITEKVSSLSPLFLIIVRDGALFFFLILVTTSILTMNVFYKEGMYHRIVAPWLHVSFSCVAARLVINLHSTARRKMQRPMIDSNDPAVEHSPGRPIPLRPIIFNRRAELETGISVNVEVEERADYGGLGDSKSYWKA